MIELSRNSSILCVDDEPGILEAYRNTLDGNGKQSGEMQDLLSRRRQRRKGEEHVSGTDDASRQTMSYNVFTASSGEEAIEIVRRELAAGRQIAAGFFDMVMPGGIDGMETIKRILQIDNQMLCAVVTAYTDRSPEQLGTIFARQDDWLYFNKPFSAGEVRQTAYHLVTAWNQRRREEALISNLELMQSGLVCILESVNNINRIPPLMLDSLLEGILNHFLGLLGSKDGFVVLRPDGISPRCLGAGAFREYTDLSLPGLRPQWSLASDTLNARRSTIAGNMAAVPLIIGEDVLGVLFVQKGAPIEHDSKLLDMYAVQAVNMIQHSTLYEELDCRNIELNEKNQELVDLLGKLTQSERLRSQFEKLSYIDALIGIPNRRYIEARFEEELSRSRRHNFSLACLMIDIDHFKKVNDAYGHAAGDHVLKEMGNILRANKRAYDVVGRYGGEEFAMIFKQISKEDTLMISERIRRAVQEYRFSFEGQELRITISIGVTALQPCERNTMESIFRKADEALYTAKQSGRNRLVFLD